MIRGRRAHVLLLAAAGLALCACAAPVESRSGPSSVTAPSLSSSELVPKGETVEAVPVARVLDGDTISVKLDGKNATVRMIGINTPETVKPHSPVECFGPEASAFAKKALTGQTVTLEFDESQGKTDPYDRLLAYVWLENDKGSLSLFNIESVLGGFARERQYGYVPYAWRPEFKRAQSAARDTDAGLWGACPSGSS